MLYIGSSSDLDSSRTSPSQVKIPSGIVKFAPLTAAGPCWLVPTSLLSKNAPILFPICRIHYTYSFAYLSIEFITNSYIIILCNNKKAKYSNVLGFLEKFLFHMSID